MGGRNKIIKFFSNRQTVNTAPDGAVTNRAVNGADSSVYDSVRLATPDGGDCAPTSGTELIAVFAAAIAEAEGAGARQFRIVSYRRAAQTSPAWNLRGRSDYLYGKM